MLPFKQMLCFPNSRTALTLMVALSVAIAFNTASHHLRRNQGRNTSSSSLVAHTPSSDMLTNMPVSTPHASAVIIVGSGLAGLSAACAALRANAGAVVLLERASKPGGNSIKASSGISAARTRFQAHMQPVPDTMFFSDTVKSAGTRLSLLEPERSRREALIGLMTETSASALDFLVDEVGVDLSLVTQLGGHSMPRTHRGTGKTPPGADIVAKLLARLRQDHRFQLKTGCEVTRLTTHSSRSPLSPPTVSGVEYRSDNHPNKLTTIMGSVVFATGGFAGDAQGMLARYCPKLTGLPSTNDPRPGAHALLTAIGAQLVDMDSVQVHPTGFVDPASPLSPVKFLAAEMLRGEGAILLRNGSRFANELATREHVSNVIMSHETSSPLDAPKQWDVQILLDPGTCAAASSHVSFYVWKGLLARQKVCNLSDATRETIRHYSSIVAGHAPDPFARPSFGHWSLNGGPEDDNREVCIGYVTPVTHFTMGGVAIDRNAQVLSSSLADPAQHPVEGLWAAGEITGGIHGDNRLGGSSLLECVVFGRIAGKSAAEALV